MKAPTTFSNQAPTAHSLVVAAKTATLEPACEILFTHGSDLTWGTAELGLFVFDIEGDDGIAEAFDVDSVRGEVGMMQFARSMRPLIDSFFIPVIAEVERVPASESEKRTVVGALASARISKSKAKDFERVLPQLVAQIPSFAGWLASAIARSAIEQRLRQHSATGLSEERYEAMVAALDRLELLSPLVRVSSQDGGLACELGLAGAEGFAATFPDDDANNVEVFRVVPALAATKQGRDVALQLFIAHYLNTHFPEDCAFPCATYGDGVELDVVVPRLNVGVEVKLCQAPASVGDAKLDALAGELAKQLPGYLARGCKTVFVVTNLDTHAANDLQAKVRSRLTLEDGCTVHAVGGRLEGVVQLCEQLQKALMATWNEQFDRKVQAAAQAGGAATEADRSDEARETVKDTTSGPAPHAPGPAPEEPPNGVSPDRSVG